MAEAPQDELKENGGPEVKLEDKKPTESLKANGRGRTGSDPDAQEMVIASLRSQIQDLFSQVTQLNGKLVKSYDRVSDLEDDLHVASSNIRTSSLKISQLELERTQHLSALNTGLLVEKSHVTSELTRLMEKATEEAAQRGQAESARADIEKDLDDLSATLFGQANSMVAEARYAQHLSERKVDEAERALKGAEDVVGIMQQQMQALQADKERAEKEAENMQVVMGKGKWTERQDSNSSITRSIRLLSTHVPYQEFLMFVAHLRSIHLSAPHPPAITTLLPLPFLARLLNEDSEPTVRLDLAPSLNWLSRRSVLSAIHSGQLTIEPMSSSALLQESSYSTSTNIPGLNSSSNNISCALCGTPIFSTPDANPRPHPPAMAHTNSNSTSWSTSLFKKPSQSTNHSVSANNSQPSTPPRSISQGAPLHPPQIHIFRLTTATTSTVSVTVTSLPKTLSSVASSSTLPHHPESTPSSQYGSPNPQSTTIYPLCPNTWCLARLRTTCSLWAFVRTGIVERIWEEEVPTLLPPSITPTSSGEKPPIPPRRRGLWGMASALGEKAASWSESDKDKAKKTQPSASASLTPVPEKRKDLKERDPKKLPAPPPHHPTITAASAPVRHSVPPPLPKRSEVRRQPSPTKPAAEVGPTEASEALPGTEDKETPVPTQPPMTPLQTAQPSLPLRSPHRSNTPSNVPLPESRPQTPVIVPSVSGAPAGAVPPPLPRRAAARAARPGGSRPATPVLIPETTEKPSIVTSPEGTTTKTEETPQPEPAEAVPVKEEEKVPSAEVANDPAPAPESSAVPPDTAVLVQTPDAGASAEVSSSSSEPDDVFVDAKAEVDEGQAKGVKTKDEEPEKAQINGVLDKEAPTPTEEVTTSMDENKKPRVEDSKEEEGAGGTKADSDKEAHADVKQESGISPQQAEGDESKEQKVDKVKDPKSDEDKDMYIGDATWEERTWKELIRLREDMFWARVGAMRP